MEKSKTAKVFFFFFLPVCQWRSVLLSSGCFIHIIIIFYLCKFSKLRFYLFKILVIIPFPLIFVLLTIHIDIFFSLSFCYWRLVLHFRGWYFCCCCCYSAFFFFFSLHFFFFLFFSLSSPPHPTPPPTFHSLRKPSS